MAKVKEGLVSRSGPTGGPWRPWSSKMTREGYCCSAVCGPYGKGEGGVGVAVRVDRGTLAAMVFAAVVADSGTLA